MATAPMKSQPLHNFSLPFLKWGATTTHQQQGRGRMPPPAEASDPDNDCDQDHDSARPHRVGSRSSRVQRLSFPSTSTKAQKEAGERLQKQQATAVSEAGGKNEGEEEEEAEEGEVVVGKPWNLRPRKVAQEAVVNAAVLEGQNQSGNVVNTKPKSMRLREMVESRGNSSEKKEKSKFWITLSREEIEEDVFVMTGSRPARRPRKRPKNIQKQLDNVFPGLWLVGLTVDSYRVSDTPIKK